MAGQATKVAHCVEPIGQVQTMPNFATPRLLSWPNNSRLDAKQANRNGQKWSSLWVELGGGELIYCFISCTFVIFSQVQMIDNCRSCQQ